MVKAFHNEGIKVILDVVFNHSVNQSKLTQHSASVVLMIKLTIGQRSRALYQWTAAAICSTYPRCGRKWVVDCLRYWVEQCHWWLVRFDLASVLGRDTPDFNSSAQLFDIKKWASLQNIKLIAEPLDIGHYGYQVGNFPSYFAEWTTDSVMISAVSGYGKKWRIGAFAERFAGSIDLFKKNDRLPILHLILLPLTMVLRLKI